MILSGYTVEVTGLSPLATEKDLFDFFSHCGEIEHLEILGSGQPQCTAYITFKNVYSVETAILLSGATIAEQRVYVSHWGSYLDESNSHSHHDSPNYDTTLQKFNYTPGEAVTIAQQVVHTMISKGYILSKDALTKAKAFDESYKVSTNAGLKVAEFSKRVGLTDKINSGVSVVKYVDETYHVSAITSTAAGFTGRTAVNVSQAVVNSDYFAKGALWVSSVLDKASKYAAYLGSKDLKD